MRHQTGSVYKAFGAWHLRYRVTEDGQRIQKSTRICDGNLTKGQAREKSQDFKRTINATAGIVPESILIGQFWKDVYWKHLEENMKPQTLHGYLALWTRYIQPKIGDADLKSFTCPQATEFLTSLRRDKNLSRNSVSHVRGLISGMFMHAKQTGVILTANPFTDAVCLGKFKKDKATGFYTLDEAEQIFNALKDNLQSQCIFFLAAFLGLRPGEICALKWSDVDTDWIHIRRSAWQGNVGEPKTEDSVASVPLIEPLKSLLAQWKTQVNSAADWCFPNRFDQPYNMSDYCAKNFTPVMRAARLPWKGLYAGRRGAATLLRQLTGNDLAGQYVLRHKSIRTTQQHYAQPVRIAAVEGMRLLESHLSDRFKANASQPTPTLVPFALEDGSVMPK